METGARDLVASVEKTEVKDPDVPEGTEMVRMTVREALRDAMAEEMRKDDRVFVMGEEVAEYQGAYKVTQGLLDEFGDKRVIDTRSEEHTSELQSIMRNSYAVFCLQQKKDTTDKKN